METNILNKKVTIILGAGNSGQENLCNIFENFNYDVKRNKNKTWIEHEYDKTKLTDFISQICNKVKSYKIIEELLNNFECNKNHLRYPIFHEDKILYFLIILHYQLKLHYNKELIIFLCFKHPSTWGSETNKEKFHNWLNYNMMILKILNILEIKTFFFNNDMFILKPHVIINKIKEFLNINEIYFGPYKILKSKNIKEIELPGIYIDVYNKLKNNDIKCKFIKDIKIPLLEPEPNSKCYCLSGKKYKKCICNYYIV